MVTSDQDSSGNCSQDPVLLLSVGKELLFLQTGEQIQENNYFCSNKRTTTGTVTLLCSNKRTTTGTQLLSTLSLIHLPT